MQYGFRNWEVSEKESDPKYFQDSTMWKFKIKSEVKVSHMKPEVAYPYFTFLSKETEFYT